MSRQDPGPSPGYLNLRQPPPLHGSMPPIPIPLMYGMQPFLVGGKLESFYEGTKEFERFYKELGIQPKSEDEEEPSTSHHENGVKSNSPQLHDTRDTKPNNLTLNAANGQLEPQEDEDVKDPNIKFDPKDIKFIPANSSLLTPEQRAMYKSVLETWSPGQFPQRSRPKKRYICDQCFKEFKNGQNLYLHVTRVHSSNTLSVLCDQCDRSFKNKHYLYMHRMNKHYDEAERTTCQHCNQEFRTKRALHIHVKKVHPETLPILKCHDCGKTFDVPHKLKYHIQRVHGGEDSKLPCHICQKMFKTKLNLKKHIHGQHTTVPRHKCVFCDLTFKSQHHMKRHVLNVHPPLEARVNCPQCSKEFKNGKYLNEHMQIHTTFEKQLPCDQCDKMFHTERRLRKHKIIVHVDEPRFRCDVCDRVFAHLHYLRRHMESVHADITDPDIHKHECHLCHKKFKLQRYLNNHMNRHAHMDFKQVSRLVSVEMDGDKKKAKKKKKGGTMGKPKGTRNKPKEPDATTDETEKPTRPVRNRKKVIPEQIEFIKCEPVSSSSDSSDGETDSE